MTIQVDEETRERIERLFVEKNWDYVISTLESRVGDGVPLTKNFEPSHFRRIRYAVLKLSRGNRDEFERAVELANLDWRDLLVSAGFGNDVTAHERWMPELHFVFIPSLVSTLLRAEGEKGQPLTEEEVLAIRDNARVRASREVELEAVLRRRGYEDIDPENCWQEWLEFREGPRSEDPPN